MSADIASLNSAHFAISSTNEGFPAAFFDGLIDDVRVYNRALTPAEITTDMNTPVQ